jgi:tetratricopeptide (TPR) repeat protein
VNAAKAMRSAACVIALAALVACRSSSPERSSETSDVNPNNPLGATLLMEQGLALVGQNKIADGLKKYDQALALQPKNPVVHNLIGVAELRAGETAKALDEFNRALALAPTYSDARNNRGTTYVRLGQYAMAETDFFTVLGDLTYANRAGVYFNLGSLYFGLGNLAAAEENLRRAAVPSGPVDAYFMLGQVEEKLAKPALAESAYRDAFSRAPERADIALALARLLESQGRSDEAREVYRKIIELAPNSPEAAEVRNKLGR